MTKKNAPLTVAEQRLKKGGEASLAQAEELVTAGIADKSAMRASLEQVGHEVAECLGVSKTHAQAIIDGVINQFNEDMKGYSADSIDGEELLDDDLDLEEATGF